MVDARRTRVGEVEGSDEASKTKLAEEEDNGRSEAKGENEGRTPHGPVRRNGAVALSPKEDAMLGPSAPFGPMRVLRAP